jgi:hypothetical protein
MKTRQFSVTGLIAIQTQAHNELTAAIKENRAVSIYLGECRVTTCASVAAARLWIGKSKRYTIRPAA